MTNVELLKEHEFSQWQTGGGCTAWGKDFGNGKSVLLGRDGSDNVDGEDTEYKKQDIHIGIQFDTEQGSYVNVESKDNNVLKLINFAYFLNELDNEALQELADYEPFITI